MLICTLNVIILYSDYWKFVQMYSDIGVPKKKAFFGKLARIKLILKRRKRRDFAFRIFCFSMLSISSSFLILIFFNLLIDSYSVLYNYKIVLPVSIENVISLKSSNSDLYLISRDIIKKSTSSFIKSVCNENTSSLSEDLFTEHADIEFTKYIMNTTSDSISGVPLTISWKFQDIIKDKVSDKKSSCFFDFIKREKRIIKVFNYGLFGSGDSYSPEFAGFLSGLIGSLLSGLVAIFIAMPIGVLCSICLVELMPKNVFLAIIEVALNNLASVPSIIFGVLGFTFYISLFGLPRGSSLVAGLTLAVMMLPHIIISTKIAITNVPNHIRDAAVALGASRMQALIHHILPISFPGIVHGALLSISRVIGESSPLLMLGLVSFVVDIPSSIFDKATVLPVQVYMWSNSPNFEFVGLASVALIVLLIFLFVLYLISVRVRRNSDHFSF